MLRIKELNLTCMINDSERITEKLGQRLLWKIQLPRYNIRESLEWCQKSEDCSNADVLCNDMVSDHAAVLRMQQKYPEKFR